MKTEYTTWAEVSRAIDGLTGGWGEWTYDCLGENLGTHQAVVAGYSVRRRTADEKAQSQQDFAALVEADLNSRTPLHGGKS